MGDKYIKPQQYKIKRVYTCTQEPIEGYKLCGKRRQTSNICLDATPYECVFSKEDKCV